MMTWTGLRRLLQATSNAWLCIILTLSLSFGIPIPPALAHGFQTAYLELQEQPSGLVDVAWKTPTSLSFGDEGANLPMRLNPVFPQQCEATSLPQVVRTPTSNITHLTLDCGTQKLAGQTIAFSGLANSFVEVLLRVQWANGRSQTTMLPNGQDTFPIPDKVTVLAVGQTYLKLGIEHIFSGIDHLLFVLGLVLIVGPSWRLAKTITAFTLAHSVTLGAATLGWVHVPQAPVEAVIALSILFLASELAYSLLGKASLTERYPWLVALTFGLLHGFGFAGALAEVGLPPQDIPPALLFFNIGVELGQLAFVLVIATLMIGIGIRQLDLSRQPRWSAWLPAYGIGTMASFWCFQRIANFFY